MLNNTDIITQFITIAMIHLFAVMSPGPDFVVIAKQSIQHGRKISIYTALGIGTGILIHILYCLIGIGLIASKSTYTLEIIKILGALYLVYIGISTIKEKNELRISTNEKTNNISFWSSFSLGFFTNVLNPKATLFFLSLYSVIIKTDTTFFIQIAYGLWMAIITALWFCLLSAILTNHIILKTFQKFSDRISLALGAILIIFGIRLLFYNII